MVQNLGLLPQKYKILFFIVKVKAKIKVYIAVLLAVTIYNKKIVFSRPKIMRIDEYYFYPL